MHDRGLIALHQGDENGVFLSWRLFGTEPLHLGFNVYRQIGSASPLKIDSQPLTAGTNFIVRNTKLDEATAYFVRAVQAGRAIGERNWLLGSRTVANYAFIRLQYPLSFECLP